MEDRPPYQTGPEPDRDPEPTSGPTTDELIALARAHRQGEVCPTLEELLRNLPRMGVYGESEKNPTILNLSLPRE